MYGSASPDGKRLVYVRYGPFPDHRLRILDLVTGAVDKIDVPGYAPAWSPAGDLIAYVDMLAGSVLKVVRPDGTGQRQVSSGGDYELSVTWSPDGKWLAAATTGRLIRLVNVETGAEITLTYSAGMRSPSWRP
jgi:TolB protein